MSTVWKQVVVPLLVVLQLGYSACAEIPASGPIANTTSGRVMGAQSMVPFTDVNITTYKGIPYAEPPIGALRFAKPIPKRPWQGVRDAVDYGPMCPQKTSSTTEKMDEECLYLNIFIPSDLVAVQGRLPVMVWIHGGSFTSGKSDTYNGMVLATHGGVIIVNLNYRLGLLGFLSTGDDAAPGNYGLWDQKLAIEWVKNNIENFGGDPQQITIFGESAGSISVSLQAISPVNDRSLFQRVIAESGAADDTITPNGDESRADAATLGMILGCGDIQSTHLFVDCLRMVPAENFVNIQDQASLLRPCLDGDFLPDYVGNLLRSPHMGQYDLLIGVNSDDGSFFAINPDGIDADTLRDNIADYFIDSCRCNNVETLTNATLFFYTQGSLNDTKANQKRYMLMGGDTLFYLPTFNNLHNHYKAAESSQYGTQTFLYYFPMKVFRDAFIPIGFEEYIDGAPHAADVPYVFGLVPAIPFIPEAAKNLSFQMMTYWTNFAKSGTPNSDGLPIWPTWDPDDEEYIILDASISTDQHLAKERMTFWSEYIPTLLEPTDSEVCRLDARVRTMTPQEPGALPVEIRSPDGVVFGTVIGYSRKADSAMGGKGVTEFLGIPYAQPPLGDLRFQPSRDISVLPSDPLDLTHIPPACPQVIGDEPWMVNSALTETNEDCLTLNIYAPNATTSDPKMPVVVYIHHGFGLYGTASVYDATTLSSMTNAVVVVINYRLGALGFLSTQDDAVPGNAGLHDVITALKWINKYIGSFHGDPGQVTVLGYGTGASLVHLLTVSDKTKGLFQRVVLMGGSAFTPIINNPMMNPADQATAFAKKLGCPTGNSKAMVDCLQGKPAADLVENTPREGLPFTMAFPPVVDGNILLDSPADLIRAGKVNDVDCIIGITQSETDDQVADLLQDDWDRCPNQTEVQGLVEVTIRKLFHNNPELVSLAVVSEYLEGHEHNPSTCLDRQRLRRFMLDVLAAVPSLESARHHSTTNNAVYLYSFDQEPKYHYRPLPSWAGTTFGDDLQYLFGFPYWPDTPYPLKEIPAYRVSDRKTTLEWTTLLSNYINYGSPGKSPSGVEWPRFSALNAKHLSIDLCPEIKSSFVEHTYRFWTDVIPAIDAISGVPPVKPTQSPVHEPTIDGGLGLKLTLPEANTLIQALFGTSVCLVVLCLAFAAAVVMLRMRRRKNADEAYPGAGENGYTNKIEIASI